MANATEYALPRLMIVALMPDPAGGPGTDSLCRKKCETIDTGAPVSTSHQVGLVPLMETGTNRCSCELKTA